VTHPFASEASKRGSVKNMNWKRANNIPRARTTPIFLINVPQTFVILSEKIPREKRSTLNPIDQMVTMIERMSCMGLSCVRRRGKILKDSKPVNVMISFIKSTGTTEIAPARIPSPNLRAPSGELSRYENIYPHKRMGKKVIIIMGISENISIKWLRFIFQKFHIVVTL
jgi:hypothetical protein